MQSDDDSVSEDDALDACQMAWDERGLKAALVYKTHAADVQGGMEFTLSDESIDRMGDIISALRMGHRKFRQKPDSPIFSPQ